MKIEHAPGCEHYRPPTDFGFLTLDEAHEAFAIILDIGTVQDEIDEVASFTEEPERIKDDDQTIEEFLAWCEEQKATWQAAQAVLLNALMEWASTVELGQRAAPSTPEEEARLIDLAPRVLANVRPQTADSSS